MNDVIDSALQKGAFGLLFLILAGLGFLAWKTGPGVKTFLEGLIAEQRLNREALGAFREVILVELKELRRVQELAVERIARELDTSASGTRAAVREHVTATGQHSAQTAEAAALIALSRVSGVDADEVPQRRSPTTPMKGFATMRSLPQPPPSTRAPAVVLIVEDDEASARALQHLLHAELKIVASVANSATKAHAMLRTPATLPRIAIIDLHLGVNDAGVEEYGDDLAKTMPRSVAIIMVSGAVDRAALERLSRAHAVAWFEKPIDFDALLTKVKEILATA